MSPSTSGERASGRREAWGLGADAQVAEPIGSSSCIRPGGAGPFDITRSARFCFLGTRSPSGPPLWETPRERGLTFEAVAQESCRHLGMLRG